MSGAVGRKLELEFMAGRCALVRLQGQACECQRQRCGVVGDEGICVLFWSRLVLSPGTWDTLLSGGGTGPRGATRWGWPGWGVVDVVGEMRVEVVEVCFRGGIASNCLLGLCMGISG